MTHYKSVLQEGYRIFGSGRTRDPVFGRRGLVTLSILTTVGKQFPADPRYRVLPSRAGWIYGAGSGVYHRRPMGTLVALEGIDGSGKSTQASLLSDQLRARGFDAVVFREPGDSAFGDKLRQQFRDGRTISAKEEARLFIEDRRIDVRENIRPALVAGKVVVMDRYYFSTMAYQGALGLNTDQLREANELFAPRPDLTLILDLSAETSAERIHASRESPDSYEGTEYLRRVRELFLEFCESDVVAVDAAAEVSELSAEILRKVLAVVGGC